MRFDFKDEDVKSWANRNDVKKGNEGFFFKDFFKLKIACEVVKGKIRSISSIDANCFYDEKNDAYPFFLPLNKTKIEEDKPKEKKYRPFKTIRELENTLNKNANALQSICVGEDIFLRYKGDKNLIKHLLITNIDKDINTKEVSLINSFSPQDLFDMFEIRVSGKWLPFGIEVKEDE